MKNNRKRPKLRHKFVHCLESYRIAKGVPADVLRRCTATLEKIAKDHYSIQPADRHRSMKVLSERWFKSLHKKGQDSFYGGRKNHSYYSFAQWVDKHYYIIPIEKAEGWRFWVVKLLSYLTQPKI